MVGSLLLTVLCIAVPFLFYFLMKGTAFELNLREGSVWSFLILRELIMILLPLVLLQAYGVKAFPDSMVYAKDENVFEVSLLTLYAITLFIVCLAIFSRFAPISHDREERVGMAVDPDVARFANASLVCGGTLLTFAILFLNYKHVFLDAILSGGFLVRARLDNVYSSGLPTQLAYLISLSSWIVSIYSSILLCQNRRRKALVYFLLALLFASASGDKAPVLMVVVISVISFFYIRGSSVSAKKIFLHVPAYSLILFFATYFVVSLQIDELTIGGYQTYLVNRLGVGQMAGVFETFSIQKLEGNFFWHMIPFASLFVDYSIYDKSLMMFVEGYDFDQMGVKNSLFISEAYGIGGWLLMLISPIIVGLSWAIGARLIFIFMRRFFGRSVALIYAFPLYILSSPLTGGFSSFPLFKGLILTVLALGVIWFVFKLSTITFVRR